jgi:hypothetical protein
MPSRPMRQSAAKLPRSLFRLFELNFGVIAMVLVAALSITVMLMVPEIQFEPANFLSP